MIVTKVPTVVVIKDGVVNDHILCMDAEHQERVFTEMCHRWVPAWSNYDQENREAVKAGGYAEFDNGSVCMTWAMLGDDVPGDPPVDSPDGYDQFLQDATLTIREIWESRKGDKIGSKEAEALNDLLTAYFDDKQMPKTCHSCGHSKSLNSRGLCSNCEYNRGRCC